MLFAAVPPVLDDLRYALRTLRHSPSFALGAILTLALGIGANTALFSVVNAVLLRPLGYREPDRLVHVFEVALNASNARRRASALDFRDWRAQATSFEKVAAHIGSGFSLTEGEPEFVLGQLVTDDLFEVLGVAPALGGGLRAGTSAGAERMLVLSHTLWQRRYGGDPSVVGRTVSVNDKPYTIAGVMPAGFHYPSARYELWARVALEEGKSGALPVNRGSHYLQVVARLKQGVSLEQSQAEMSAIAARLSQAYPDTNEHLGARVIPLRRELVGDVGRALLVLLGAVGVLLLIACGNVTSLLLARASGRGREVAIRTALGAGRMRLVRQFLTETLVLYGAGAVGALLLASFAQSVLVAASPGGLPRLEETSLDGAVLAFTLVVSLSTALVFGLGPALHLAGPRIGDALKAGGRTASESLARRRAGSAVVVAEVALSVVLLVGAALALRSFVRLTRVDTGLAAGDELTFNLSLPEVRFPEAARMITFYRQLLERLGTAPGVGVVGLTTHLPLSGQNLENGFSVEGYEAPAGAEEPVAGLHGISPGYFAAMGIPILRGRAFTPADQADTALVAIVNEAFVRSYWPGHDPIGKRLRMGGDDPAEPWRTVVGVSADVRRDGPATNARPDVDLPYDQLDPGFMTAWARGLSLVVRSSLPSSSIATLMRGELRALDPTLPMHEVETLESLASQVVAEPRFRTSLLAAFAGLALTLAMVGVFGVTSYFVSQRTREIGIRVALGARPGDVLRLILARGAALALLGLAIGLALGAVFTHSMRSLLFEIEPTDAASFLGVALLVTLVALLASYIPARRALKIDPITALRAE